ncbi:MAG: hypothetical protein KDD62_04240, partial [Bdellovibrionales bacterium]|nr:hypothetical protein [Bdellovibrionales bacterium]
MIEVDVAVSALSLSSRSGIEEQRGEDRNAADLLNDFRREASLTELPAFREQTLSNSETRDELMSLQEGSAHTNSMMEALRDSASVGNRAELDEQVRELGRAVRQEATMLRELGVLTNQGASLDSADRAALSRRWNELKEVFYEARELHQALQDRREASSVTLNENATTLISAPGSLGSTESLEGRGAGVDLQDLQLLSSEEVDSRGNEEPLWEQREDGSWWPTEAAHRGQYQYELEQAGGAIRALQEKTPEELIDYLRESDPQLSEELANGTRALEASLRAQGVQDQFRIEGPIAHVDGSLPEMFQDPETGAWHAVDTDPIVSFEWKLVEIQTSTEETGRFESRGELSFEDSLPWDRGEMGGGSSSLEDTRSAEGRLYKDLIISGYTQWSRIAELPEAERTESEQEPLELFE